MFKIGLIILPAFWLILAVLAIAGLLVTQVWALVLGLIFAAVGLPFAIWVAKQDVPQ